MTALGWLIVTRDSRIREHRAEIGAVRDSEARLVALGGQDARGTFDQLEVFMSQWRAIMARLDEPGPCIYTATRTTFRKIDITG